MGVQALIHCDVSWLKIIDLVQWNVYIEMARCWYPPLTCISNDIHFVEKCSENASNWFLWELSCVIYIINHTKCVPQCEWYHSVQNISPKVVSIHRVGNIFLYIIHVILEKCYLGWANKVIIDSTKPSLILEIGKIWRWYKFNMEFNVRLASGTVARRSKATVENF